MFDNVVIHTFKGILWICFILKNIKLLFFSVFQYFLSKNKIKISYFVTINKISMVEIIYYLFGGGSMIGLHNWIMPQIPLNSNHTKTGFANWGLCTAKKTTRQSNWQRNKINQWLCEGGVSPKHLQQDKTFGIFHFWDRYLSEIFACLLRIAC